MTRKPITKHVNNLRQRERADGTWRVWWEPTRAMRKTGLKPIELSADKITWTIREAQKLNENAARHMSGKPLRSPIIGRSVRALADIYQVDDEFLDLKPKTQQSYSANIKLVLDRWADDLVTEVSKPDMRKWYKDLRKTGKLRQAQALLGMASILFEFAEGLGWRSEGTNPAQRIKTTTPPRRSRTASWDEVHALIAAADDMGWRDMGLAVLIAVLQGQRQTDVIQARMEDLRLAKVNGLERWVWKVLRSKRGTLGAMALHPKVQSELKDRLPGKGPLLLDPITGKAFTEQTFQSRWKKLRARAAKAEPSITAKGDQLQFRDLRRTFGVMARESGVHVDDVGDVLGNSVATNATLEDIYMPPTLESASRAILAVEWVEKKTGTK